MTRAMKDFEVMFDVAAGRMLTHDVRPPRRASYSALDTYGNCPAQWAFGRLWRETPIWDDPLTVGSIAHAALELAVANPADTSPSWLILARRAIIMERERNKRPENRWKGDPIPVGVKAPNGQDATDEDWARLAANRLNGFRLTDVFDGPLDPAAAEQHIDATVWGIPMTGNIDYRDRTGRVVDWKTGRLPDFGSPKEQSHQTQLRVYKALLDSQDIPVTDARDVYVEHRERRMADLSDGAMESTGALLRGRWDDMRRDVDAGSYPLRPSYLCPWCPLARVCPLASPARSDKARKAAARGISPDDSRIRMADPLQGMIGDACPTRKGTNMDDLLDMLDGPATPTPKKPAMPDIDDGIDPWATPSKPKVDNDPWATPEGQEAAARWGMGDTAMLGGATSEKTGTVEHRMTQGKPYDPSILFDGSVNSAGYGFTRLLTMAGEAYIIDPEHTGETLLALIRAGWAASRTAWERDTPDIPGLKEGRPERKALLQWLDTPLARDADEMVNRLLPSDGTPAERIGRAGREAAKAMAVARNLIK